MTNSFSLDFLRLDPNEAGAITGEIEYIHSAKNESGTAYLSYEGVSLLLRLPRLLGAKSVAITVYDEAKRGRIGNYKGNYLDTTGIYDEYKVAIKAGELPVGLYFFNIEIEGYTRIFGYKSKDGIIFKATPDDLPPFQFSVCDFKYAPPTNKYGGVIYHVFVDRFFKYGNVKCREDAVLVDDWFADIPEYPAYPGAFLKNNYFYGGTLYGVEKKLEYLSSLGVNTIYLSPIFEAYSNHKYDTGDYSKVDEMFGGDEAFRSLIKKAKKLGIGIVLDGVFNHTGSDSIYFNKNGRYNSAGAYNSTSSPYYNWYRFQSHPDKYTCWWGIDILPRIHPEEKECSEYFVGKGGIIEKYAEMGVDGFRLDVADELSDEFIAGIKSALNNKNSSSILYGEVWEDASNKIAYDKRKKYYLGDELDAVMNYPLRTGIIDYVRSKDTSSLEYYLKEVMPNMPKRVRDAAMNLLGTHDTERILTVLGGISSKGKSNDELLKTRMTSNERAVAKRRLMCAYTLLATLPGIPCIFYGDEAGLEGYSDPFNRRTFPWGKEDPDLLCHYRKIGHIRTENPVYAEGEFKLLHFDKSLLVFERISKNERYITVVNNSDAEIAISFKRASIELIQNIKSKEFTINSESAAIFKTDSRNLIYLQNNELC